MIFYFSGTGNSYYAAKKLSEQLGCGLTDMAVNRKQPHEFHLENNEPVGFVFPVYFFTLNDVVYDYVQQLSLSGNGYTFAVITCGGNIGGSGKLLSAELKKRGIRLDRVFSLQMPDNAVFYYDITDKTQTDTASGETEAQLQTILAEIKAEEASPLSSAGTGRLMRGVYHLMASTKKFYATDACIHCGKCAKNCPDQAIAIRDGAPVWVNPHCTMCGSCINRCPVRAVQYGKGTVKRNRYEHPILMGASKETHSV